jgi:hypothetical protein
MSQEQQKHWHAIVEGANWALSRCEHPECFSCQAQQSILAANKVLIAARAYVAALEASDDRPFYGTGSALDKAADALVAAVRGGEQRCR